MKYTLAIALLLNATEARHHHQHRQMFAQATPASNRAAFEAARASAAATVDTQQKFEATKTADVASRNAANSKATFDLRSKVRLARQHQIENEVHHDQWVTRGNHSNWAQIDSPADSRKAFESGVASAADVVAKQKAFEAKQTADITSRHASQADSTFKKKAAVRAARVDQTRGGAKNSRDSRGWRVVWPAGSLAQEETPEESYAAKDQSLKNVLKTVDAQNAEEAKRTSEIANAHSNAAGNTADQKLKHRNLMDDVTRGGAPPARDSLGWSVAQQPSTMGGEGQIGMVHDFLTGGTDEMRGFIAEGDTIGAAGYDPKVHAFVRPNIVYQSNDVNYSQKSAPMSESLAQRENQDTIGNGGIAVGVHTFVEPILNTYD